MQVFYNLTPDECQAAALRCNPSMQIVTDEMIINVGVDENHQEVILVRTDDANVLLTNGDRPYPETKSGPAPANPWVYAIDSDRHLINEAERSTCASLGGIRGISVAFGEDHANEWFATVSIMEKNTFMFRLPSDDLGPWSTRAAQPVLPGPQEPKLPVYPAAPTWSGVPDTGDPELDTLLKGLEERRASERPPEAPKDA